MRVIDECEGAVGGSPLISVRDLTVKFGNIVALENVSFNVPGDSIYGLIGPNGAGKTTLFNALCRLVRYHSGGVWFEEASLSDLPVHAMPALGIARTFQNLAVFGSMSVLENVLVGAHNWLRGGGLSGALRLPVVSLEEERARADAEDILRFLDLWSVRARNARDLPFGTQKRVELARALLGRPRLLLLDEPAAGLTQSEVRELEGLIREVRARFQLTVLIVEHHMGLVMNLSERIAVLNFGRLIAEGEPREVQGSPAVVEAYLGTRPNE